MIFFENNKVQFFEGDTPFFVSVEPKLNMFGFEFDLKDHHNTTAPVNYGL